MTTDAAPTGPTHGIEIELKFDVDAETPLPDLTTLPGVTSVSPAEDRSLDAVYVDTADLQLGRAAIAVRRRRGGPDEGWHVKTREADGSRHEYGWPLDEGSGEPDELLVPDAVRAAVAAVAGEAALGAIARVRNARAAYTLRDADGAVIAEFTDDRVVALDLARRVESTWREWELELGPAAPTDPEAFFAAATAAVQAVGGRPSAADSKLQRALGR